MSTQKMNITEQQVVTAAGVGVDFLNLETTLIPGNLRKQLSVLEVVLTNIASGSFRLVSPEPNDVESGPQPGDRPDGLPDPQAD